MQENELTLEQRIELIDIELKEIGKIIAEMTQAAKDLIESLGLDNE